MDRNSVSDVFPGLFSYSVCDKTFHERSRKPREKPEGTRKNVTVLTEQKKAVFLLGFSSSVFQ